MEELTAARLRRMLPGYTIVVKGGKTYVHGSFLDRARTLLQANGWAYVDCTTTPRPSLLVMEVVGVSR